MSRTDQPAKSGDEASDIVVRWWAGTSGDRSLYERLLAASVRNWEGAAAALPESGPGDRPAPPDRPTPRIADLPELQAFRAALQDDHVPFDTIDRWLRSLTQMAQSLGEQRPATWAADDVAQRCVGLARGDAGSLWSTLEAIRAFWRWHPERAYIKQEVIRLQALLRSVAAAGENA